MHNLTNIKSLRCHSALYHKVLNVCFKILHALRRAESLRSLYLRYAILILIRKPTIDQNSNGGCSPVRCSVASLPPLRMRLPLLCFANI